MRGLNWFCDYFIFCCGIFKDLNIDKYYKLKIGNVIVDYMYLYNDSWERFVLVLVWVLVYDIDNEFFIWLLWYIYKYEWRGKIIFCVFKCYSGR